MDTHTLASRTHRPRRPAGFTLIELLVVISIIALLIAVLLPSLKTARDTARRIKCASSLRQVGLSIFMYADDNNESLPPGQTAEYVSFGTAPQGYPWTKWHNSSWPLGVSTWGKTWMDFTFPYHKSIEVLTCDSAGPGETPNAFTRNLGAPYYGYNMSVWPCNPSWFPGAPTRETAKLSQIKSASSKVLALDYRTIYSTYANAGEAYNRRFPFVHVGGTGNILAADGHGFSTDITDTEYFQPSTGVRNWNVYAH